MNPEIRIVICHRGWVLVGEYALDRDNDEVVLSNALVVRRWGTTAGLGQLAIEGRQPQTILDPCGVARIPRGAVVATFDCNPEVWCDHAH